MRFLSVTSGRGTISVTRCATTTPAAGMEETARLTSTILGRTAQQLCSVGATLTMGSVMASATALDVSMMALIARVRKDNATLCMTSTARTTMQTATVTKAATMQNVNGMALTVPTTCQRSWQMVTLSWWSISPQKR